MMPGEAADTRPRPRFLRAAPRASALEAVLLALAASLYVAMPRREGLSSPFLSLAAFVWISPIVNPPSVFLAGCVTPLLLLLLMAAIMD